MILIDTSAWVEFLRSTGSPAACRVRHLIATNAGIACCDPIRMEVLAGARDPGHLRDLRALLARTHTLALTPADYEDAAALYRGCRAQGITVRALIDCLIAAAAIRSDVPVLHCDVDFDGIASAMPLAIDAP